MTTIWPTDRPRPDSATPNGLAAFWLSDPASSDAALVGGKAAHLARLARDFNVPPGFVVVAPNGDGRGSPQAVAGDWQALEALVGSAYERLAAHCGTNDPPVAVRSSALDEDGRATSFAGQYETYLNIAGAKDVAAAVAECWASAYSERALEYRAGRQLPPAAGRLPVLVQRLVHADAAGIVFTANPVTSDRGEVVINVSWGLGESVVGGGVTPDTYVIERSTFAIAQSRIARKLRMTIPIPGGSREIAVPPPMQLQPAISDEHAIAAARLAVAVEDSLGVPVDVECAWAGGELHLLQARPITTLKEDP